MTRLMTLPGLPDAAWLGIDLGTSSVKVLLAGPDGAALSSAREPLALLDAPGSLAAEQDAEAWWQATCAAVRRSLEACPGVTVCGVGLTGQKHALLPLDVHGRPLVPAVLWADGRATAEAEEARRRLPDLARRTGAPALPGYLVPKWLRLRRRTPDVARRTAHLCFAKDWIRYRLTGVLATDRTEASASQVYDARLCTWSADLARIFDLPIDALPPVFASTDVTGQVHGEGGRATGLEPGTPVVAGAGDNEAAALACGAIEDGVVAVVLGTSGTVVAPARRRGTGGALVWGDHVLRSRRAVTGVVLSAGRALSWITRAAFPDGTPIEAVIEAAEAVAGEEGLPLFVPSLVGERSPVPDAGASGAFVGLRPHHGRGHLARAVLEGVALALGQVVDRLRGAGVAVEEIRLTSGGAASGVWRRLVAAASGAPARLGGEAEGPARGAALLAASAGSGDRDLALAAARWDTAGDREVPPPEEVERLQQASLGLVRVRDALRRARRPRRSPASLR